MEKLRLKMRTSSGYYAKSSTITTIGIKSYPLLCWDIILPSQLLLGLCLILLVDGNEAVIHAEVEISSLRIIQEAELSDARWVQVRSENFALIDARRINIVCHGQLYQNRMARAFNKKVRPKHFSPGQLILKWIFPNQDEAKGKFSPNWQGPYIVSRVLTRGALILAEMNSEIGLKPINTNVVKRYYI
ncbi:uncharacterized protein LOC125837448 [Solanum verrucosum]|uniref:uncharacterized protein LOC125837448 n=1 Tax=Solanum verrucosum TaxID=315347 RepID=UPI0020D0039A|nr:uncharacterized protein LOC125837448 [Solanum verrucosum]